MTVWKNVNFDKKHMSCCTNIVACVTESDHKPNWGSTLDWVEEEWDTERLLKGLDRLYIIKDEQYYGYL